MVRKNGMLNLTMLTSTSPCQVYKIRLEKRVNEIVNRLNKTKREDKPDFRQLREERDQRERDQKKAEYKKQQEQEKLLQKQREEEAKLRSVRCGLQRLCSFRAHVFTSLTNTD